MTMLSIETPKQTRGWIAVNSKRLFDLVLSLLILAMIWPLIVLSAAAVALTSRGPVFFVQRRVGLDGKPFKMIKFRSMLQNAEDLRDRIAHQSDREGLCIKIKNDPRTTRVGRFLRRWSLDELPQLFNVIRGDMSLVGPRPALVEEVDEYPERAHLRHRVQPGITGLWQVSGRAEIGFEEMIDLDLAYVRNCTLRTDLVILFRTFRAVLDGRGAY
ncbi:sugar transferase [Leisingera sp. ANG-Vp]|uniref:sugar transferase n=1 Tax=Leisingera sp. ANG-Vp TaxID=1577896 RepID=UPI0006899A0F|nr:exopolysaccharide biosynthesis polyprenyl glycosylphosphotransferase [Leisingera sp. ANG-Vp]